MPPGSACRYWGHRRSRCLRTCYAKRLWPISSLHSGTTYRLAFLLSEHDPDELRARANDDPNDSRVAAVVRAAAARLADQLAGRRDVDGRRAPDIDGLRARAAGGAGDGDTAVRLIRLLARSGKQGDMKEAEDLLRARVRAGDWTAGPKKHNC